MKTVTWEIEYLFDRPKKSDEINFREAPLEVPPGVEELVRRSWLEQLRRKQRGLRDIDHPTSIRRVEGALPSLYEGPKRIMWPGPVVSLKAVRVNGKYVDLFVGKTTYPFIRALGEQPVTELYEGHQMKKPLPALGIGTYAITVDDRMVFTLRGNHTAMYPGRIYGQGGNPEHPYTDLVEHQLNEMEDEILVRRSETDLKTLRLMGIVRDEETFKGKPCLMGWVKVKVTAEELKKRMRKRPLRDRPSDAIDIVCIPATPSELSEYISTTPSQEWCPTGQGGVVLYGHYHFGKKWAEDTIRKIERYN
jgi:hypothetical protein